MFKCLNFEVFHELAIYSHTTFKAHLLGLLGQHILGGDAEVLRAGVPHFFPRAARGYEFPLYFGLYHQYYLKSC